MKKRMVIAAALIAFALGGLPSAFAILGTSFVLPHHAILHRPLWTEVKWSFPIDEWGEGKAFRCDEDSCGTDVYLYIRPKIGFCNCTTGVSDDDELDRLSDYKLMGDKTSVLEPGHPIKVAGMKGRSRAHSVARSFRTGQSALAIAFNSNCDAVVATAVMAQDNPMEIEPLVIGFLNSDTVMRWTKTTLGP